MKFQEKTEFGLLGERIVMELLRNQKNLSVTLNTGPGYQEGFGKRFHANDNTGSEVIPDIEGYRAGIWPRQPFWVEVKTKSAFACFELADYELRTGIDQGKWLSYRWFHMTQGPVEFHFCFVHPLSVYQTAGGMFRPIEPSIAGIYKQSLQHMDADAIKGSDGKFYWPLKSLKLWQTDEWLMENSYTRICWNRLVMDSKERINSRILTDA